MIDREAYIVLNMLSGIGPARLATLLSVCGTPSEIFACPEHDLAVIQGIGPVLAEKIAHWERYVDLKHELDLAERGGVRIITRGEENYPELLGTIHDAPVCLYVRGEIPDTISYRSLAVVGTRNMTQYGQRMAQHLSEAAAFAALRVDRHVRHGQRVHIAERRPQGNIVFLRLFPRRDAPVRQKIE